MSLKRQSLVVFFLLVFVLPQYGKGLEGLPPLVKDTLDQYVLRGMKDWNIPGLALCIVKNGEVLISKGYGVTEQGGVEAVDANTLFMIGSNTKAFAATALAMLEFQGKCSLEDKVQKWLPEFTQTDTWVASEATLKDLLCHRLGYETFQGDFMYWDSDLSSKEVLNKFGKLKPQYPFRSKFGYTNAAFHAAGMCIEKISGLNWDNYIRQTLVQPLEMDHTLFRMEDLAGVSNKAIPHTCVNGILKPIPYCNIDNMPAAASMSSSVNDMSHWMLAQLNNGRYHDEQVIPFPVLLRTRMPQSIIGRNFTGSKTLYKLYGLGWFLQDYDSHEIVYHTGAVDGFLSSFTLIPEEKLGIIILTNTDDNDFFETLKWELIDAFLGIPTSNYNGEILAQFKQNKEESSAFIKACNDTVAMKLRPGLPLEKYCGRYTHPVYGYLDIRQEKNKLLVSFEHHSTLTATLEFINGNRFLCTYSNPVFGVNVFPFEVEGKKVKSLTLSVSEFIEKTTYLFVKNP
jgi:CubicO group peptidase (beta-lactamase class C family)